jgi:membrane dipeptidase
MMKLVDMHCDTLWRLMDLGGHGDLYRNDGSISIEKMKKVQTKAQFFACFTDAKASGYEACFTDAKAGGYEACYQKVQEMIRYLEEQVKLYSDDIAFAKTYEDLEVNEVAGKISAVLTVEEGGILNGSLDRLELLYRKGVRLMTLMWNYENCIGHPNSTDGMVMLQGLKGFGVEVVHRMSELGMLIDISHASDGTFWDVLECAKSSGGTVVASHSNCRALCHHPRNLTDKMIRALADQGGVAGLNFYGSFLDEMHPQESRLETMVLHVKHMIDIGGSEFPAIGTDFDGFDGMTRMDIPDVSGMGRLWEALKASGITERQLDQIWHKNAERVFRMIR